MHQFVMFFFFFLSRFQFGCRAKKIKCNYSPLYWWRDEYIFRTQCENSKRKNERDKWSTHETWHGKNSTNGGAILTFPISLTLIKYYHVRCERIFLPTSPFIIALTGKNIDSLQSYCGERRISSQYSNKMGIFSVKILHSKFWLIIIFSEWVWRSLCNIILIFRSICKGRYKMRFPFSGERLSPSSM